MFIDLYEVFVLTRRYKDNTHYLENSFLLCPVLRTLPIMRDPHQKWFVSYDDIPKHEDADGDEFYPPSCSGWLYITTPGTARRFANVSQGSKFFWIDDIWVTGYLAKVLGIEHQDLTGLWTMNAKDLLLYKTTQSPHTRHADYLAGPNLRNYELSDALHTKAKWCFINKCYNSIYEKA